MSEQARKRMERIWKEVHDNYDVPPKIYLPGPVALLRGGPRVRRPNTRGTRAVSKLQRRAIPFRYGTEARRKLVRP